MPSLHQYLKIYAVVAAIWSSNFQPLLAQGLSRGYVVTATGDTVRGFIVQKSADARRQQVRLRISKAPVKIYTAAELRSFSANPRDVNLSKLVGNTVRFVSPLVLGHTSLYNGINPEGQHRFYLQAPVSARLLELMPIQAQLQLLQYLGGCPSLRFGTDEAIRLYTYIHGA